MAPVHGSTCECVLCVDESHPFGEFCPCYGCHLTRNLEREEVNERHWKLERSFGRYLSWSNWDRDEEGAWVVIDFRFWDESDEEYNERAVGKELRNPFNVNAFEDLIHAASCNIAALRDAANVNQPGVYMTCLSVNNPRAAWELQQALYEKAQGAFDWRHFTNAARVLERMVQQGGARVLYIGCTRSFSARYAAVYPNSRNNVRLHHFLRQYAAQHPADFSFDYKILATCPHDRVYRAEAWVGECARLDVEWDQLSTNTGERLVLNRERLGQQH